MPSGTVFIWPPSRDVVPEARPLAPCWLREAWGSGGLPPGPTESRRREAASRSVAAFGAAAAFQDRLRPTDGASRPGSFLSAGHYPVAQGTQPVQHLVGAPAEVVVQGHVLRVQLVVHRGA